MTHGTGSTLQTPGSLQHCRQHRVPADSPGDAAPAGNAGVSMVALHFRQATIPGLCACPPWRQLWPAWQLLAEEGDTKAPEHTGKLGWLGGQARRSQSPASWSVGCEYWGRRIKRGKKHIDQNARLSPKLALGIPRQSRSRQAQGIENVFRNLQLNSSCKHLWPEGPADTGARAAAGSELVQAAKVDSKRHRSGFGHSWT